MLACQRFRCQNVRIHHHEPSMALARVRPSRGYQIHVDYQVRSQTSQLLVVSWHERKIIYTCKGDQRKENKDKVREHLSQIVTFYYKYSCFPTCTTLSPYYKIYKKWKIQRRKKKNTNLNYPKLQNGDDNYPKLCISSNTEYKGGIYRQKGHQRECTELRVESQRAAP